MRLTYEAAKRAFTDFKNSSPNNNVSFEDFLISGEIDIYEPIELERVESGIPKLTSGKRLKVRSGGGDIFD